MPDTMFFCVPHPRVPLQRVCEVGIIIPNLHVKNHAQWCPDHKWWCSNPDTLQPEGHVFCFVLDSLHARCGAWTHNPMITSLKLYQLGQLGTHKTCLNQDMTLLRKTFLIASQTAPPLQHPLEHVHLLIRPGILGHSLLGCSRFESRAWFVWNQAIIVVCDTIWLLLEALNSQSNTLATSFSERSKLPHLYVLTGYSFFWGNCPSNAFIITIMINKKRLLFLAI